MRGDTEILSLAVSLLSWNHEACQAKVVYSEGPSSIALSSSLYESLAFCFPDARWPEIPKGRALGTKVYILRIPSLFSLCLSTYMYILYTHVFALAFAFFMYVCVYVYKNYTYTYIHMCIYRCVYACIDTCIHTHTFSLSYIHTCIHKYT